MGNEEDKVKYSPKVKVILSILGLLTVLSPGILSLILTLDTSKVDKADKKVDLSYELLKQRLEFNDDRMTDMKSDISDIKQSIRDMMILHVERSKYGSDKSINDVLSNLSGTGLGGGGGAGSSEMNDDLQILSETMNKSALTKIIEDDEPVNMEQQIRLPEDLDKMVRAE